MAELVLFLFFRQGMCFGWSCRGRGGRYFSNEKIILVFCRFSKVEEKLLCFFLSLVKQRFLLRSAGVEWQMAVK